MAQCSVLAVIWCCLFGFSSVVVLSDGCETSACASVQRNNEIARSTCIAGASQSRARTMGRDTLENVWDGWMVVRFFCRCCVLCSMASEDKNCKYVLFRFCFGICGHIDKGYERIKWTMNQSTGHFFRLICGTRSIRCVQEKRKKNSLQIYETLISAWKLIDRLSCMHGEISDTSEESGNEKLRHVFGRLAAKMVRCLELVRAFIFTAEKS